MNLIDKIKDNPYKIMVAVVCVSYVAVTISAQTNYEGFEYVMMQIGFTGVAILSLFCICFAEACDTFFSEYKL